MKTLWMVLLLLAVIAGPLRSEETPEGEDYTAVTQAELVSQRDDYQGRRVRVEGAFLFSGSDFCYQIRKTKINTRDYLCFAVGTPSLVRLYLPKNHPQAEELMRLKKGRKITALGVFDYVGIDYNYMIVDEIVVERPS